MASFFTFHRAAFAAARNFPTLFEHGHLVRVVLAFNGFAFRHFRGSDVPHTAAGHHGLLFTGLAVGGFCAAHFDLGAFGLAF